MPKTDYDHPASATAERLINDVFALGGIGYVALVAGQQVPMRKAPGVLSRTTAETNFYEELLVNPTLLKLAAQRAELDCGGLNYIAVGYGDFVQLIMPTRDGHISVAISRRVAAGEVAAELRAVLEQHGAEPQTQGQASFPLV